MKSAVFSALAKTPGMEVRGNVTTLSGRQGIAIGAGSFQMVFDATSGAYVGERGTDPDLPAGWGIDGDRTHCSARSRQQSSITRRGRIAPKCHGDRTRHG